MVKKGEKVASIDIGLTEKYSDVNTVDPLMFIIINVLFVLKSANSARDWCVNEHALTYNLKHDIARECSHK